METSRCEDVRPLLPLLSTDEIAKVDAERVEHHLASCKACRLHAEQFFRQDRAGRTRCGERRRPADDAHS